MSELNAQQQQLVTEAWAGRANAMAEYSGFAVGAALLTADGTVVRGCNVENSTYGLTVCAERVALLAALSQGHRSFHSVAVVTGAESLSAPCGPCRQLLWEFCGDCDVILSNGTAEKTYKLSELLPHPFEFTKR